MSSTEARSVLSIVVPYHDNPGQLELCLGALKAHAGGLELILVDDASKDRRAIELAAKAATQHLRLDTNSGPAVARNLGAKHAHGDVLVFIDSDVVINAETIPAMQRLLAEDPALGALFGSYDDAPASPGFVTEYRNLLHHWTHQNGPREATTWWAGCGAIRKRVFEKVGGFDESFRRPSIEDIELGMRMKAAGERIVLAPEIQCKHLKHWRVLDMIVVDVKRRAIPWTKLLIDRPGTGGDLNLGLAQKLCVVFVFLALLAIPCAWFIDSWHAHFAHYWLPLALLTPVLAINQGLYLLFLRRKGPLFALVGVCLHLLYFFYGGLAYAWVRATHRRARASSHAIAS